MMVKELEEVVVRFSGDSGDGMQLAGNIFSNMSATVGNDICTFPDYPADIRAPQGSLTGVSGFKYTSARASLHSRRPLSRIGSNESFRTKNTNQIL
mgnify:FL=1